MLINFVEGQENSKKRKLEENEDDKPLKKIKKNNKSLKVDFSDLLLKKFNKKITEKNQDDIIKSVSLKEFSILSDQMKNSIQKMLNAEFLTWIQKNSIPNIMSGKNTLIKSPSGTGKTLAYAIPLIEKLQSRPVKLSRSDGVFVIIIVPTKELAKQTFSVLTQILKSFHWIQPGAVFGEDKRLSEKRRIRKGLNILVSTPGRFHDHLLNTQCLHLNNLQTLVIDEADLMLDLGYENKINEILSELKIRRFNFEQVQTILLSATLNEKVAKLCSNLLNEHIFIDATSYSKLAIAHEMLSCNSQLLQTVVVVPTKWRLVCLLWFIHFLLTQNKTNFKIIIFVGSIYSVRFMKEILIKLVDYYRDLFPVNFKFFGLHGSLEIKDRMYVFNSFNSVNVGVLISTDVAARGLDFKDVQWVVQFDPARNPVDYVHRVGRTARGGHSGTAVVFLSPHELAYLDALKDSGMEIGDFYELKNFAHAWIKAIKCKEVPVSQGMIENEGSSVHKNIKEILNESPDLKSLAVKCFISSLKSYSSYPKNVKQYFNLKELHLGHLAESLGLEESPKQISLLSRGITQNISSTRQKSLHQRGLKLDSSQKLFEKKNKSQPSSLFVSEFSSSICSGPKTGKRIKGGRL